MFAQQSKPPMTLSAAMNEDVALRHPVNALISFHYFGNRDIAEMQSWGLRLIGDSGAYSALTQNKPINIDDFAAWGLRWRDNLAWIASLDVIGDKEASFKNYKTLRGKGLDVIPTIHYGCDPAEMDRYAADGVDFMGLGGMVVRKSEAQRLLRWTLSVFRYARDNHPQMRFHGWGITHSQLLLTLPWYSVDSSGFSSSYRFARLSLFDSRIGKNIGIELDGKEIFKHSDLLFREYGVDPEAVKVSTPATRRDLVRLSIASVQHQEDFLRARHKVSPPQYGLNVLGQAPNVHVALGFPTAQSTMAVNPDDRPASLAPIGPSMHIVDGAVQHLRWAGNEAPSGPNLHVAESGHHNFANVKEEEK